MTKRPILEAGKRESAPQLKPFCGRYGFEDCLRHAHYHYFRDVVRNNYGYHYFHTIFSKGHEFHDEADARMKNEHAQNFGLVCRMLKYRRDLVEKYFVSEYELDYSFLKDLLIQDRPDSNRKSSEDPTFDPDMSSEMIDLIVRYANDYDLFTDDVDNSTVTDFFDCNLRLTSANNMRVAYLLDKLSLHAFICTNWQSVVTKRQLINGSRNFKPLDQNSLSTALNSAKMNDDQPCYAAARKLIKKMIKLRDKDLG